MYCFTKTRKDFTRYVVCVKPKKKTIVKPKKTRGELLKKYAKKAQTTRGELLKNYAKKTLKSK